MRSQRRRNFDCDVHCAEMSRSKMKGYEIYASKRRGSPENLPISTTADDFYEFIQEFKANYQDIDGAFIMMVYLSHFFMQIFMM